ncbi:MAG: hypothetical protein H0X72_02600 [Acidobacteria bacterium]|jgi:hypothetical protein|nr:hypothetical protein [Acidobacteriota bacterium]
MKNKKALVFGETKGLDKNFDQSNFKPSRFPRQYLCSFCWRELSNNSVRFNGIGACPVCFKLSHLFVDSLRRHRREYSKRFEVKR